MWKAETDEAPVGIARDKIWVYAHVVTSNYTITQRQQLIQHKGNI